MGPVAQPAREVVVRSGAARLYVRDVGRGRPIVVGHGGPDFDHEYLLPELDLLADSARLVYYDRRGRGRSFHGGLPEEVTIATEVQDLDEVRRWIGDGPVVVLGHSWGGLLAVEYAIRHPTGVSHLILINTSPCSHAGALVVRQELERRRSPEQARMMTEVASSAKYGAGDIDADLEYYRMHFASALYRPDRLEDLIRQPDQVRRHLAAFLATNRRSIRRGHSLRAWTAVSATCSASSSRSSHSPIAGTWPPR